MLYPDLPIALETSSLAKYTSARFSSSLIITDDTRAGAKARVMSSCGLLVKGNTSIFSLPNSRTMP